MWRHLQNLYKRQGGRLTRSENAQNIAQTLIENAKVKGWDVSALQTALDAFSAALPEAKEAYSIGAEIIANHNGFDIKGKVTKPTDALDTLEDLRTVLKNTRAAMKGTGESLVEALKAFRETHQGN